jgi:predicted lipoprotein with Yx(FWY)xxD motif
MKRIRLSLPILVVIVAATVAIIVATSGGGTSKAQTAVAANSAISLKQTSVGKVLVDANGRTLYLFAGDKRNVSTLSAAGRAIWPPFTSTTRPQATGGVAAAQIGTATGTRGRTQITYNGHPLYYYVGDHQPGQTAGQGLNQFGGRWYALAATGAAITSAPKSAPTPPASTGSGSTSSYGY